MARALFCSPLKRKEVIVIGTHAAIAEGNVVLDPQSPQFLKPFALRYMEMGAPVLPGGGKTATSRQTSEDGEEEADTDWDDT